MSEDLSQKITASWEKIQNLLEQAKGIQASLQQETETLEGHLRSLHEECQSLGVTLHPSTSPKGKFPPGIDPQKLPTEEPENAYEKIASILLASNKTEGLTTTQIVQIYQALRWKNWEKPNLLSCVRGSIKTLRHSKTHQLVHSGQKRGSYKLIPKNG